ncbi:MAG TPA: patatin-like phospholipase family protein, partial [Sulfurovum sp.]|nr:patatin-like phospholipase family protein [Sulfurovum sp.]
MSNKKEPSLSWMVVSSAISPTYIRSSPMKLLTKRALLKLSLLLTFFTFDLHAEREKIHFSMVISGGVSLGAYEAGYNWAVIKVLGKLREREKVVEPELASVAGASAGSINSLLTAMYWC